VSTVQFSIPKNHPALPAILEAAKSLPDVVLDRPGGVAVTFKRIATTEAYARFFEALKRAVGDEPIFMALKQLQDRRQPVARMPDPLSLLASLGGAGHDMQAIMSRLAQQLGSER
jgi:hypothetical protein